MFFDDPVEENDFSWFLSLIFLFNKNGEAFESPKFLYDLEDL